MDTEMLLKELNGQLARLVEAYNKKSTLEKEIEDKKAELNQLDVTIKELNAIIQTLQVIYTTNGFTNLENIQPQQQFESTQMEPPNP